MKKILTIGLLLTCSMATRAQSIKEIKVGPEVGALYSTMHQKINGVTRETNYQLGFKVGAVVDLKIDDQFALQPGLFLSAGNGTESFYERYYKTGAGTPASEHDRRNYKITYVQLPVYALYKTGKEFDDPHFFFGIGPSFNYAIGGNYKQEYITTLNGLERPTRKDMSLRLGNNRAMDNLRRFDLAANVMAGFEAPSGLFFRAHYSIGILNVAPGGNSNSRLRNSHVGLSIGFLFKTSDRPHWE